MSTKTVLLFVILALAVLILRAHGASLEARGSARALDRAAADVDRLTGRRLIIRMQRRHMHGGRYYAVIRLNYARNS